jgi:hypothetical protein
MSPSVKVDPEVFAALQALAEPFVDSPNSVLRRLLGLTEAMTASPRPTQLGSSSSTEGRSGGGSAVSGMREAALAAIQAAFDAKSLDATLTRTARTGAPRRGPRDQRYESRGGQVIYLRTRSYDNKPPFFTMQPNALSDADWFVFACESRGSIVMPGEVLRDLAPGLHRDAGGDFKPTFVIDGDSCALYAFGELTSVREWRDAFAQIAEKELVHKNQGER